MPLVAGATDRLAAIARHPILQLHSRGTGGNHAPAANVHHLPAGRSVAHGRIWFACRALLDALYRSRELHRELLRDVLDRLAPCGPHHRTALTPGCAYGQTLGEGKFWT